MQIKNIALLLMIPLFCSQAWPDELKKSALIDVKKDFAVACALSKVGEKLSHAGFSDPADLQSRLSKMFEAGTRTLEVKNTFHAVVEARPEDRDNLWMTAAKDVGLTHWSCPGIGNNL